MRSRASCTRVVTSTSTSRASTLHVSSGCSLTTTRSSHLLKPSTSILWESSRFTGCLGKQWYFSVIELRLNSLWLRCWLTYHCQWLLDFCFVLPFPSFFVTYFSSDFKYTANCCVTFEWSSCNQPLYLLHMLAGVIQFTHTCQYTETHYRVQSAVLDAGSIPGCVVNRPWQWVQCNAWFLEP